MDGNAVDRLIYLKIFFMVRQDMTEEDLEQEDGDSERELDENAVHGVLLQREEDQEDIEQVVEAVLFSAGRPLTIPEIEESIGRSRGEVRDAVKKVRRMYQNRKTALEISKIGRKYSLQLRSEFNKYGMEMMDQEMSRPLLKTAALIAYYQPIRQSELKKMVGEKIYDHVDELIQKDLILSEKDGRTYSLRTSPKFQEYFGLEAKDRNELKKLMAKKAGITD